MDNRPSVGASPGRRQRLLVARRSIFPVQRTLQPSRDAANLAALLVGCGMPFHVSPASDDIVVQQTSPREPSHSSRPLLRLRLQPRRQHQRHLSRMRNAYANKSKSNRGRVRSWGGPACPMRAFSPAQSPRRTEEPFRKERLFHVLMDKIAFNATKADERRDRNRSSDASRHPVLCHQTAFAHRTKATGIRESQDGYCGRKTEKDCRHPADHSPILDRNCLKPNGWTLFVRRWSVCRFTRPSLARRSGGTTCCCHRAGNHSPRFACVYRSENSASSPDSRNSDARGDRFVQGKRAHGH